MARSAPKRVVQLTCVDTSAGMPLYWMPPMPVYRPSVFSRTTTKSISLGSLSFSGVQTPGYSRTGRRLMYWSSSKRVRSSKPFSRMPGAILGCPTAPR